MPLQRFFDDAAPLSIAVQLRNGGTGQNGTGHLIPQYVMAASCVDFGHFFRITVEESRQGQKMQRTQFD
ncbi:MAG: hypothetical protein IIW36_06260 [Clostridia bacterium]|nr:hypothetical protein [Clostridia bacterium]